MTQQELANRLGKSQQFLSLWLYGERSLSWDTAKDWGKELGILPADLMDMPISDRREALGLKDKRG